MARLNRAAFSRADIEDAKRGHPDFDLRDHAARRGLEFLDHGTPAGFRAAVPGDEELQSNVLRGVLPGGEYGVLANEGLEIGYTGDSPDWGGSYYGLRVIAKGDFGGILGFVPVANWFVGSSATATVRVPCTLAAVRVPETAGSLTHLRFDRRRSAPPFSFGKRTKLAELVGEKGWDLYAGTKPDPEVVARLLAEPVAALLRAHTETACSRPWSGTGRSWCAATGICGLPKSSTSWPRRRACSRGACARSACRSPSRSASTPRCRRRSRSGRPPRRRPASSSTSRWCKWAVETAERHGLELEDPLAYHRAFPSVPVPGTACVVLRGTIPRLGVPGRLVVHRERGSARPAVVIPAPEGAEPTPPGGRVFPEHGVRLEIADGLLAVWSINSYWGSAMAGDLDAFCASVAAALDSHATTWEATA